MAQAYIKDKNPAPPVALGPLVLNTRGQAFAIKQEDDHLVTKDIFESAQLCEKAKEPTKAKESTHCMADFEPVDIVQNLHDLRMELWQTNERLNRILEDNVCSRAVTQNIRINARNCRIQGHFSPLQKTIPGHGLDLSMAIGQQLGVTVHAQLVAPIQIANVGDVPPDFSGDIRNYENAEILQMVNFYNNDFGIMPADCLGTRIDKFRKFLLFG